ncbi:sugar phosphate isomerase/epimerase [Paenibacillus sp. LHD-117]|uniref:sugar phosphate isomerase/epimerase family protein n=1 Tax=Paenibacillus sp. LHD-117 TaxID=3071412 RepID=UPI0027E0AD3B|nr:sugar phosphate isomerase/epimerase [Paenibacillus sp. LHD-117]MDQ6421631.1 sugar phosphate isomerase/epimerase [Paenibacillus sp. LHD-117]
MKFRRLGDSLWEMSKIPPGLQLFSIRNEINKDFFGALKQVAEMGYRMVEFAGYGTIPSVEIKRTLSELGLQAVSSFFTLDDDLQQQIDYATTLGIRYLVISLPPQSFEHKEYQATVSLLTNIARLLKRRGMQLLYHPHDHEFEQLNGQSILDRLLADVGTDLMQLEIDLYWARKAGLDPKSTLLAYKGIVPLIHVKDMAPSGEMTEVGQGVIDWPSVFRVIKEAGVHYYFVEQDVSPHPMASAQSSLNYLKSIGVA